MPIVLAHPEIALNKGKHHRTFSLMAPKQLAVQCRNLGRAAWRKYSTTKKTFETKDALADLRAMATAWEDATIAFRAFSAERAAMKKSLQLLTGVDARVTKKTASHPAVQAANSIARRHDEVTKRDPGVTVGMHELKSDLTELLERFDEAHEAASNNRKKALDELRAGMIAALSRCADVEAAMALFPEDWVPFHVPKDACPGTASDHLGAAGEVLPIDVETWHANAIVLLARDEVERRRKEMKHVS